MSALDLAAVLFGVTAFGIVAQLAGFARLHRSQLGSERSTARLVVDNIGAPARLLVPLIGTEIAGAALPLPPSAKSITLHAVGSVIILAAGWMVLRLTYVLYDLVARHYAMESHDNLQARRVHTQIQVLRRITAVVVAVISIAVVLLSFSVVRAAGAGLLASAGVIALLAGVAAKPVASNVIAGIQIAFSQPIRVDDVVVVDGHWGRIEQITLTYVVVQVWDLRRLVLPISYFIEEPFENWTRASADILGWVHLEVDFTAPVDEIRAELHRVLAGSPDWDGKVEVLQVTGIGTETMQLRALMSSPDSSRSWNLQCLVREELIAFLRREHPLALPRLRTERATRTPPSPDGDGLLEDSPQATS